MYVYIVLIIEILTGKFETLLKIYINYSDVIYARNMYIYVFICYCKIKDVK